MSKTIIIIGAGLAGLSAALQAAENGCNVKLVSSLPSERAQSVMAEGGINAALNTKDENDSPEEHFTDTIKAACGLADPNAVWGMTQAAPELVHWLLKLGVKFNMSGYDDVDLRNFGGQKKKRTAFAQSDTGKQIMTAMIDAVRRKEASGLVERFSHHSFLTLRLCGNICCGCVIRDEYSQETVELPGDAVIVATGGMHGLFGNTTGSLSNTGEVTAELFRLGVPLANGEMIQYHPTTVKCGGKRILISEAARGEGGRLFAMKDGKQWYFMEEKYPELGNLMPRDITAREIWKVSHESEVFLDMTEISEEIISNKLSGLADDCMTYLHKDIRKEPVSVLPGIHYFMGGILVDEQHRTPIQNLYAAGECCAQYHGANRLGGNSLLGALYGGRVAAKSACEQADTDFLCTCSRKAVIHLVYKIRIRRQESQKSDSYWQEFEFDGSKNSSVANVLKELNSRTPLKDNSGNIVTPINWECSCMVRKCGACAMLINERPRLACSTFLHTLKGSTITLEPLSKFPLVRDLIVDRSILFENLKKLNLWLESEAYMNPWTHEPRYQSARCLMCGCCLEVCPNFSANGTFAGAVAAVNAFRILNEEQESTHLNEISAEYKKKYFEGCGKSLSCHDICPIGLPVEELLVRSNAAAVWGK